MYIITDNHHIVQDFNPLILSGLGLFPPICLKIDNPLTINDLDTFQ
jgi:hypothetical protein